MDLITRSTKITIRAFHPACLSTHSLVSLCAYQIQLLANFHNDTTRSLKLFEHCTLILLLFCISCYFRVQALRLRAADTRFDLWSRPAIPVLPSYRPTSQRTILFATITFSGILSGIIVLHLHNCLQPRRQSG
jgi:hypothetical protein